ncbi:MAG: hypothetical protein HY744_13750 [Deltaproteobacteria bacterium]|nr:hypothetical protein [Deltaproteobacteria bacterium]
MRAKIIAVFTLVVALVIVLSFGLVRTSLADISNRGDSPRAATGAVGHLEVEALRVERWLGRETILNDTLRDPFDIGEEKARQLAASRTCDAVSEKAKGEEAFLNFKPSMIAMFDRNGIVLGRDGSALMRGENLGDRHPRMLEAVLTGVTGSDVWFDRGRHEQLLASYAPIRSLQGQVIGGIVVGTTFNHERLGRVSEITSGNLLVAAVPSGRQVELVIVPPQAPPEIQAALKTEAALSAGVQALASDQAVEVAGLPKGYLGSARRMAGYGDGKQGVIMAVVPLQGVADLGTLLWPLVGAFALGLLLVVVGSYFLDAYISRPVSDLEEGLLMIINGQRDVRFELEHAVLGGLVSRINSLLNELLEVEEDTTDDQGRPSIAPPPIAAGAELNVDERHMGSAPGEVEEAAELGAEAEDAYQQRLFEEYVAARESVGDPVGEMSVGAFAERVKGIEKELGEKHGVRVRFLVEPQQKSVVLVAVPLK